LGILRAFVGVYSSVVGYPRSTRAQAECLVLESDDAVRGATLDAGHDSDRAEAERGRLSQGIAALQGTTAAGDRRKKARNTEKSHRRRLSARKRLSEAKQKWWAERKKKATVA
jgi:hypothetical protein